MICVYEIWIGEYYYHGQTNDIVRRMKEHLAHLINGNHYNKFMQRVYNKYKTFEYQILVECSDKTIADVYEQDFINANWGLREYLNLAETVKSPPSGKGKKKRPQTEEHKRNAGIAKGHPVIINGIEYYSQSEAARCLGKKQSVLSRWINGTRKCPKNIEIKTP